MRFSQKAMLRPDSWMNFEFHTKVLLRVKLNMDLKPKDSLYPPPPPASSFEIMMTRAVDGPNRRCSPHCVHVQQRVS